MLKTSDANQNALTAFAAGVFVMLYEDCKLVIVTEENRVAIVDRLSRLLVLCSCANLMVGTPEKAESGELAVDTTRNGVTCRL